MEQRNNLVLQGTETFSRGQLDNLALENGALVLDSVAGRSLLYGSYTTPEFAMPAFCNLNVSWNAHAPRDTMVEVRCRVYAAGAWTSWMSFGKWAPDYPRCSVSSQSEDGMIFLMGDTVTVAAPGGGTGVQLQVNLSTNNDKVTPAVRLLAAAVRPLAWEKRNGHALNRRLYLPEYCLSAHDPSFGREMDLPLVMAALMNRWGEDILPEEVAYAMEDGSTRSTGNTAFAAAAAGCCGYPCWQAWMDLKDLREQIHDGCSVAVRIERRIRGQRDPIGVWMGLRGFGHDDAVLVTGSSDLGAVDLEYGLTSFDDVVGLDEALEAVAVHVDGIDANVHQNLDAAIGLQAHGVTHGDGHLAIAGSVDQVVLGPHSAALAQNLATKDGIGHVGHLDDLALDRRAQHVGAGRSRDGGRSSSCRGLSLLLEHVKQTHTFSPLD